MKLTAKNLKQLILEVMEDEEKNNSEDNFDLFKTVKRLFKQGGETSVYAANTWMLSTGYDTLSDYKFSKLYNSDWEQAGDAKSYNSIKFYFETKEDEKAFKSFLDSMGYENDSGIVFGDPQPGKYFYEDPTPGATYKDLVSEPEAGGFEVIV